MFFYEVKRANGYSTQQPNRGTYEHHKFICDTFQHKRGVRDVQFVVQDKKYYVVSPNQPVIKDSSEVKIKSTAYNPEFEEGCSLRFDVRLDAETRVDTTRKSIVTAYKERLGEGHGLRWNTLMHDAAADWLRRNSKKYGFRVRDFFINGHHHYNFKKTTGEPVIFDSLDIRGVLEVSGPAVFVNTLHQGIGKARVYGCGLMLVAR